ncbi:MAG TPA: tetratricopeptide repeat protein [Terriglobia bacterium]|nr:tetratricopeptide repeat protein [Terriglobia bacterium]
MKLSVCVPGCCALLLVASLLSAQSVGLARKSQHAKELMAAGKFEEAIPIYRELVRAVPGNPGLITNLGLALDMSGDMQDATREYEAAFKLDPNYYPVLLLLGTAYLDLGQPAKAIDPLERSLRVQPDNFDAQEELAEALLSLGRLDDAAHRFRELSQSNPNNAKVWYGLGLCYEGLAQRNFDLLARVSPGSAYWLDLVAESRFETKQNYSAFYFYRQALAKMPLMHGVHAAIAEIYRDSGHSDWASVEEKKERDLPPPDCSAHKLECDFQAGNFISIIDSPERTKDPEASYWKTRAYNKLALDAYLRLGQLPASTETYELEAKIESKRRHYAEAAKDWREALRLSPRDRYLQKQLGITLYQMGDLPGAQTLFQKLLAQEPHAADLNYFLGDTILKSQKPQEAITYLENAVRYDPKLLPAERSLGLAYLQVGRTQKAIPHLKNALPIDDDGSAHYQLGRAYQINGERSLAATMFKQYQEIQHAQKAGNNAVEKDVAITPPD